MEGHILDVTSILEVSWKFIMKNRSIENLGKGIKPDDAVTKRQLYEINERLESDINNIGNQAVENNTEIKTINTNNGYYYFTDQLKHDNSNTVKFPVVNNNPYSANNGSELLRITLDGSYHIIYTDFYKKSGQFIIHDDTNGNDLFVLNLANQSDWTPITINAVIPITVDNGFGHDEIKLYIKTNNNAEFDGAGYSTFYIKYLHA